MCFSKRSVLKFGIGLLTFAAFLSAHAQTVLGVWTAPPGGRAGADVANVGDVDGDGFPDFAFGIPGDALPAAVPGSVLVVSSTGATITTINVPFPSFGSQVVALGDQDVPPDGIPEIAVGAPAADALGVFPNSGVLFVYDTNGNPKGNVFSAVTGEAVGSDVANLGDLNGDGLAEIGLRRGPFPAQAVEIYTAVNGVPILFATIPAPAPGFTLFGASISRGGDYTLDGVPETVITDGRLAYVFDGATQANLVTIVPASPFFSPGYASAADIGDVNGDLINDLALGDTTGDVVDVMSGASLTAFPPVLLYAAASPPAPTAAGNSFGISIVGTGIDGDGDMFPEFLIGAAGWPFTPGLAAPGFVTVASGLTGVAIGAYVNPMPSPSPVGFGTELDLLDVNADGLPEILVGAPGGFAATGGQVFVISPIPYLPTSSSVGAACNVAGGSAGTTIAIAPGSGLPRLGTTVTIDITGAPPNTAGTLFVGAPLPPTPIGGCTKYLDEAAPLTIPYAFTTDGAGAASVSIAVPGNMTIVLAPVNAQAAVGTEVSNALQMTIGG